MIQHKNLIGMAIDKRNRGGKMSLENQNIVHQLGTSKRGYSFVELLAKNKLVIRFVLNDMTQSFQSSTSAPVFKDSRKICVANRPPADHSANEFRFFGKPQQLLGLFNGLSRLHRYASRDSACQHFCAKIFWQEISRQGLHARTDPPVLLFLVAPKMVVRVYSLGHLCSAYSTSVS